MRERVGAKGARHGGKRPRCLIPQAPVPAGPPVPSTSGASPGVSAEVGPLLPHPDLFLGEEELLALPRAQQLPKQPEEEPSSSSTSQLLVAAPASSPPPPESSQPSTAQK